jgi:hypothetical protein
MNQPSEPDVEVFEHIPDTYAEFDPVPEDVLAAARGALAWGPAHAAIRLVHRAREQGPRTCRVLGVQTSAAAIGGIRRTAFSPAGSVRILGDAPPHVSPSTARAQPPTSPTCGG